VVGDLNSDKIHLTNFAKVRGKLSHKSLSVDEGAQLEITAQTRKRISNLNKE
jgi:cytoskeletal protein CcmA (bactofilin family)